MTDSYDDTTTAEDDLAPSLGDLTFDLDADGYAETTMLDTTDDGLVDTMVIEDPYSDAVVVGADLDGDGVIETVAFDDDGDGIIDGSYSEAGMGDVIVDDGPAIVDDLDATAVDEGPFTTTTENPVVSDDGVHGDPQADIEYHQTQPGPVDCLPTSVAMSLTELTGAEVPADDVIAMANSESFMTDAGMSAEDSLTLFESYGVDAELSTGTVDGLREALDAGDTIVVGIDSADLYADGGGPFDPGMESGHAVVITGIDDGPPGVVYINDPGFPDGAGVAIPLDQFEDSWDDSDHTMVVATPNVDVVGAVDGVDGGAGAATAADAGLVDGLHRLILLPLNFKIGG